MARPLPDLIDGAPARAAAEALAAGSATVFDAFAVAAVMQPDLPFLCIPAREERDYHPEGFEITYGAALAEVMARRDRLEAAGYRAGHRVALMLDNRPEHVFSQLALYALGVTQVPVNPDYLDHELTYLLEHSEADLALGLPHNVDRLSRVADALGVPAMLEATPGDLPAPKGPPRAAATGRQAEAALIYTSGTTGRPKGCVIDHEYHFAVGLSYARIGGRLALRNRADRVFVPLPVFHVNAGINTLTALILTGNCLILPDRFHPATWWRDIKATRATAMHYLGIIPPILLKRAPCEDETAHSLRFGLGAGLDPQIHQEFEARFGVPMVEVWGMSETGRFLGDCHEPRRIHTRAFGKPSEDLDARVVDEDGNPVPPGTEGELVVRAHGKDARHGFFREYLKNPDATAEAWRSGWFHTGDVVVQEPDGMLHFVERRKNIIRRSGENISAAEVENALIGHPGVEAVAVIGVTDEMRDEEVMACVIPMAGTPRDEANARSIFDHGRDLVAYYKLPGWIAFVDDLPRTGTQKVRKGLIFPGLDDPRQAPGVVDLRALKKRGPDMKRAIFRRHGDPAEVIEVIHEPDPVPGPGQVRVRLKVMTINPADLLNIEGRYGAEPVRLPATPGVGAYGIVDMVGEGVTRLAPGDAVLPVGGGLWADAVVVHERMAPKAPDGADPEQAAMMRANPATAEIMLTGIVTLSPGDWVVQNAANSAVGRLVIRYAREKGLKTVNIVRRADVVGLLVADGADAVIVDDGGDLTAAINATTGGTAPRLALDAVGGRATAALAAAVADHGTVAVYGLLSGQDSRVGARDVVFRGVNVRGFWLADWYAQATPDQMRDLHAFLTSKLASGDTWQEVEERYPLSRVKEAVAHAARGGRNGKVLLTGDHDA